MPKIKPNHIIKHNIKYDGFYFKDGEPQIGFSYIEIPMSVLRCVVVRDTHLNYKYTCSDNSDTN